MLTRRDIFKTLSMAPLALILPMGSKPTEFHTADLELPSKWERGVPCFTGFKPSVDNPNVIGQWLFNWYNGPLGKPPRQQDLHRFWYVNVPGSNLGAPYLKGDRFDISDALKVAVPKLSVEDQQDLLQDGLRRLQKVVRVYNHPRHIFDTHAYGPGFVPDGVIEQISKYRVPKYSEQKFFYFLGAGGPGPAEAHNLS